MTNKREIAGNQSNRTANEVDSSIGIEHLNKGLIISRGVRWAKYDTKPILAVHPEGVFSMVHPSEGVYSESRRPGRFSGYKSGVEALDAFVMGEVATEGLPNGEYNVKSGIAIVPSPEEHEIQPGVMLIVPRMQGELDLDKDNWKVAEDRVAVWEKVEPGDLPQEAQFRFNMMRLLEGVA